ncbi:hypothetical protein PXJ20_30345 [Paraburkholderia sp. A1RI_3L]
MDFPKPDAAKWQSRESTRKAPGTRPRAVCRNEQFSSPVRFCCPTMYAWLQSSKEAAMDAESIAGLVGLTVGLLVLLGLTIFESRTYRREHHGEGMMHHWLAEHHMLDWTRRRH